MEIILLMLMAWVPEAYFAATDGVQALAWGFISVWLTIMAINAARYEDNKKSASRGND